MSFKEWLEDEVVQARIAEIKRANPKDYPIYMLALLLDIREELEYLNAMSDEAEVIIEVDDDEPDEPWKRK
jgi:hypothetical protein